MSAENQNKSRQSWLTSKEAKAKLRVSSCQLMHLREGGHVRFQKNGNAFLYSKEDVERKAQRRIGLA